MINNFPTPICPTCNREMVHYNALISKGNKRDGFIIEPVFEDSSFCRVCDDPGEVDELEG